MQLRLHLETQQNKPFYTHISQSNLLVSEVAGYLHFPSHPQSDRWLLESDDCASAGPVSSVQYSILVRVHKGPVGGLIKLNLNIDSWMGVIRTSSQIR